MKTYAVLTIFSISIVMVYGKSDISEEVSIFCKTNGFNHVTYLRNEKSMKENLAIQQIFQNDGIKIRALSKDIISVKMHKHVDTLVIPIHENFNKSSEKLLMALDLISSHKVQKSIIYFTQH